MLSISIFKLDPMASYCFFHVICFRDLLLFADNSPGVIFFFTGAFLSLVY